MKNNCFYDLSMTLINCFLHTDTHHTQTQKQCGATTFAWSQLFKGRVQVKFLNFFFHNIGLGHTKNDQIHQGKVSKSFLSLDIAVLASQF